MQLATWNVNSLKVRLPQVLDWLGSNPVDVLCLQELKLEQDKFPLAEIEAAGYRAVWLGQKTYNGVAILVRAPLAPLEPVAGMPGYDDPQARVIAATIDDVRVVCAYCVNGEAVDSDKYRYKLEWFARLHAYLAAERERHPKLVLTGDFNIAPDDRDVYNPESWAGKVLCSVPERQAFDDLLGLGLVDAFRQLHDGDGHYSWWDYRQGMFRRDKGLRIDHVLLSAPLAASLEACHIDKVPRGWERPSDHAPVVARF
ncbi:exodeoxyribonuclease III [Laribacter hongkongensis]|uniref:XthA n=1 Tax=Laribacter hongkongensis TaxID=168471 RepID=A0A248LKN1_9NEIS|nr:exodeoxyribonuclease III [Laribacter hongkongensis]ASJ25350.1 XthA [Laribacter hongkongensis]MCG9041894.1 exodeoxyribonuclease III [Laribacter hongkongensis]MCG9068794.1 exodeoxyribonuclease III [Laribacter hongkongensis]MCG9082935.1 exodeoxyribonuclease III [Laribacter hongkongensis]MCG9089536.1 exodeoxyribonuclease III [Laribacter hongkongensis]